MRPPFEIAFAEQQTGVNIGAVSSRIKLAVPTAVGPIAQPVEQRTFNPWVDGSSPSGPTSIFTSRSVLGEWLEGVYHH